MCYAETHHAEGLKGRVPWKTPTNFDLVSTLFDGFCQNGTLHFGHKIDFVSIVTLIA